MMAVSAEFKRQAGATLVVGLVMLILMTLLALGAVRLANTHVKVVANEQLQQEGQAAAVYALDSIANSPTFAQAAGAQTVTVNVGTADYTVTVAKPDCKRYRTIPNAELVKMVGGKPTIPAKDIQCITGSSSTTLTIADTSAAAAGGGESLCAATVWEVEAAAAPAATGTQTGVAVVIAEGVEQRIAIPDAQNACK